MINNKKKHNFPIDAVITWVDGSDKNWLNEYYKYNTILNKLKFISSNELLYCLKSIYTYIPWVNNVYLVTMRPQQPTFIKAFPNVIIIYHDQIFDNKYLPTFNSLNIEINLDNIPGLSEHFIYFNDDVIIGKHLPRSIFFTNKGEPIYYKRSFVNNYCGSTFKLMKEYNNDYKLINHSIGHFVYNLTKTQYIIIKKLFPLEIEKCNKLKIRNHYNGEHFWIIYAIYYLSFIYNYGKFIDINQNALYIYMPDENKNKFHHILNKLKKNNIYFICINNTDFNNKDHSMFYNKIISKLLINRIKHTYKLYLEL